MNDPFKFVEKNTSNIIQILLHPCHYKKEKPKMSDILKKLVYFCPRCEDFSVKILQ